MPTYKLAITDKKTNLLLLRTGEKKQGVVGLFQPGVPGGSTQPVGVLVAALLRIGAGLRGGIAHT